MTDCGHSEVIDPDDVYRRRLDMSRRSSEGLHEGSSGVDSYSHENL